jgi:hypothetical protein
MANLYDYLEAGRRIFPLWPIQKDGSCGCGDPECKDTGKHPRISSWQHSPHWSDEQIDNMEAAGQFETGFGVVIDDQLVIDVDPRNGGEESYAKLVKDTGIDYKALSGHVVATGGGGWHIEFSRPEMALASKLDAYPGVDFKSSGFVVGASSMHKSGAAYESEKGNPCDLTPCPPELLALLERKEHFRGKVDNAYEDVTESDLSRYLDAIPPDTDYDEWVKCGMAVHHTTQGACMHLWDDWSNRGDKYPGRHAIDKHWHSFGKCANPVTLGTLISIAVRHGYEHEVTFDAPAIQPTDDGLPCDTSDIDLLRPPGLVGQVAEWINSQCRYPREHLAAAGAILSVGNIAGLQYIDGRDRATLNLLVFARAGSSSGKEAVLEAVRQLHSAVGLGEAVHGSIKSDKGIIEDLTRNQSAYYLIDEVGIFLKKITNAQQNGGTPYLEGVIGNIMSAYSKANGNLLINGDMRDSMRMELGKQLSQLRRQMEESGENSRLAKHEEQILAAIERLRDGVHKPFLSLMGFTTPITFDQVMTYDNAANGFIGRALLVSELETNPRPKKGFNPPELPISMKMALYNLCARGEYDVDSWARVENYNERVKIHTTKEADDLLDRILDWFMEWAEDAKGQNGLEPVVRRGYEMVAKVSAILAAAEGMRTALHVRWAFALAKRDIEEKMRLVESKMLEDSRDSDDLGQALRNRILSIIDHEHSEPKSVIVKRAKNKQFSADKVKECLAAMVKRGEVEEVQYRHPTNGRQLVRYRVR